MARRGPRGPVRDESLGSAPWLRERQPYALHPEVQSKSNGCMSTSTVGFAVADEDQERLARLVEHFGHGNRSASWQRQELSKVDAPGNGWPQPVRVP